jgi:hypothetical protein
LTSDRDNRRPPLDKKVGAESAHQPHQAHNVLSAIGTLSHSQLEDYRCTLKEIDQTKVGRALLPLDQVNQELFFHKKVSVELGHCPRHPHNLLRKRCPIALTTGSLWIFEHYMAGLETMPQMKVKET